MTDPKTPTRIIATIGPAIWADADLRHVMKAGVAGFRLPLARLRTGVIDMSRSISRASQDLGLTASVYLDVPGPKKHLVVPDDRDLQPGQEVRVRILSRHAPSPPNTLHLIADASTAYFTADDVLLLGDGEIAFSVTKVAPHELTIRSYGGPVRAGRYGIAVPGKEGHRGTAPIDPSTARFISSIPDVIVLGSFIESANQVEQMRNLLAPGQAVWAKVETRRGAANIVDIAAASDGILLGRGDLLIDVGELDYFACEQQVIDHMTQTDVPLMVGTQLWTSSSKMFLPHRSELSYLCALITRGIDSILLSDETTIGENPRRTVAQLSQLIARYS